MSDTRRAATGHTRRTAVARHAFFYLLPLLVILLCACLVSPVFRHRHPYVAAPFWITVVVGISTLIDVLFCIRRDFWDHVSVHVRAYNTFFAFLAGIAVALMVKRAEGPLGLGKIFEQAIPLFAGLLVAIAFQPAPSSQSPEDTPARRARELGIAYILSGAICAFFGLFDVKGFTDQRATPCCKPWRQGFQPPDP